MDLLSKIWIFILFAIIFGESVSSAKSPDLHLNMSNYDRFALPTHKDGRPKVIFVNVALHQVIDLDERNQKIITKVWMRTKWKDSFFMWNSSEVDQTEDIRVLWNSIWHPDIELYNDILDSRLPVENYIRVQIWNNGDVLWYYPAIFHSSCAVNVKYFPFDQQACPLDFGSWTYDSQKVILVNFTQEGDWTAFIPHGEWEVIGFTVRSYEHHYDCCEEPKRLFYMFTMVFPAVLITVTSILVFCLPAASGEKVSLGVTALLTLTVFLLSMADAMPPQSNNIPLLAAYFGGTIIMLSLCTSTTVFVLNIHHSGDLKTQVPKWIKVLILDRLASFLMLKHKVEGLERLKTEALKKSTVEFPKVKYYTGDEEDNICLRTESLTNICQILNNMLKLMEDTQRKNQVKDMVGTEWMLVAMVIDRLLLIVFFVISFLVSVTILLNHPHYDSDPERFVDSMDPYLHLQHNYQNDTNECIFSKSSTSVRSAYDLRNKRLILQKAIFDTI